MSEPKNTKTVEQILKLQLGFKKKLSNRVSDIESVWIDLCKESPPTFKEIHLKLHSLVGTAGTFGATAVSNHVKKIENYIKSFLNNELSLDAVVIEEVNDLISQLYIVANKWKPSSIPFIPEKKEEVKETETHWQNDICYVEDDVDVAEPLIKYLEKEGYKVFYYRDIKDFIAAYNLKQRAAVIIMDMAFEQGQVAGAEAIKVFSEHDDNFPPVIFVSVHDDINARLAAAQAGARRYFTKPIIKHELLSTLDKLTDRIKNKPYRVLLIDDDKELLDYYSTALKNEGMDVLSFTNPLKGYDSIEYFEPELIILDLYMPECSGYDLAKVIRQNDELAYVPIIFLSSETDVEKQLSAMGLGGDDFLMKPVEINYFIQAVTARAKRSRRINNLNDKYRDALRESEYRLITLDQHAIISMTDTSGNITFANEHFSAISGYSVEELIGENHKILQSGIHSAVFYDEMWSTISSGEIWSGQVCNLNKNGEKYWVEATIVPFMDENGLPYKYVSVRTDITNVKQSEEDAHASEKRLLEQQETLNTLSTVTDYVLLEETAFFNIVTQRAAETLNVERVSIWMFDKKHNEMLCRKLYQGTTNKWDAGEVITRDDYPKYFSSLENNTVISAYDANHHPSISELSENYLLPLGINSVLDIPIRRQGYLIGVICCEHVGKKRRWRSDEQGFVSGLADLISLNLESSERRGVEVELAEAIKDAESANHAKSEFLSSMSHELRTPMNAISGFAQLLIMEATNKLDDVQKSNVKEIINASNHLLELINEILNLAKIESGNIELAIETVSCSNVVAESLSLMEQSIVNHDIKLHYQFNGEKVLPDNISLLEIYIHVDRMRFKQIVLNLLSNAVKYNVDGGSITLACEVSNDIVHLSIIDTGKGISIEGQSKLFESFNRLGEENGSIEGSGIGLVITKNLVELMGGKIGVESELGVGSTFWIDFPLVKLPNSKESKVEHIEDNTALKSGAKKTVLYIEDNPANLRLIEQILLLRVPVNMISAHEPNLGIELAVSQLPDLILLDINLPGMSGYDVLKKLKEDNKTKDIPLFAVSANAMIRDIKKGIDAGFDDYISKPIDVDSFISAVTKVLNNK